MKEIETLPKSVHSENMLHGSYWKYSTIGVISMLCLIGVAFHCYAETLPLGNGTPMPMIILNDLTVAAFSLSIVIAPALVVRLLARRPLSKIIGLLLTFVGIVTESIVGRMLNDSAEKPHYGLAFFFTLGAAYKIATSFFGLRSIGIPISLPGDRVPVKEETIEQSPAASHIDSLKQKTGNDSEAKSIEEAILDMNIGASGQMTAQVRDGEADPIEQALPKATTTKSESAPEVASEDKMKETGTEVTGVASEPKSRGFRLKAIILIVILAVGGIVFYSVQEAKEKAKEHKLEQAQEDLWNGVNWGNMAKVRSALQEGANINAIMEGYNGGRTALQEAAATGKPELVDFLIKKGADINVSTEAYPNLWHCICEDESIKGQIKEKIIILLCNAGLDPNKPIVAKLSKAEQETFINAMKESSKSQLSHVLGDSAMKGTDVSKASDTQEVRAAFQQVAESILPSGELRTNILCVAVQGGLKEAVKTLLERGANANGTEKVTSILNCPLYIAALSKRKDIVELLVSNGASVNWKDPVTGMSPLLAAVGAPGSKGNPEVVKFLLERGAKSDDTNSAGTPYILYAAVNGDIETILLFLDRGVSINSVDKSSRLSLLHLAVLFKHYECAKWLITKGADVTAENANHVTPAMLMVLLASQDSLRWNLLLTDEQRAEAERANKRLIEEIRKKKGL